MSRIRFLLLAGLLVALFAGRAHAAASDIGLTPGSLAFTYQIGGSTPASQSLGIKSTGSSALAFTITVTQPAACSAPCVTVSANSGTTPATLQVYANPSGLAAGAYAANITVNAPSAVTVTQNVSVTLTVGNPASALSASTTTLPFTYTTGGGATAQSSTVVIATNGNALTATVAVIGWDLAKGDSNWEYRVAGTAGNVDHHNRRRGPRALPYAVQRHGGGFVDECVE